MDAESIRDYASRFLDLDLTPDEAESLVELIEAQSRAVALVDDVTRPSAIDRFITPQDGTLELERWDE